MTDKTNENADLKSELRQAEMKSREQKGDLRDAKGRSIRLAIGSAIAGFLIFAVGGQYFPGYQLDSTARANSEKMVASAVSDLTAQLCAERFMRTSGLESRLTALNEEGSDWNKTNYIRNGTWAASADGEKADFAIVEKCRDLITQRISEAPAKITG